MRIAYDTKADTLYISFFDYDPSSVTSSVEDHEGNIYRWSGDVLIGVTIMDFEEKKK